MDAGNTRDWKKLVELGRSMKIPSLLERPLTSNPNADARRGQQALQSPILGPAPKIWGMDLGPGRFISQQSPLMNEDGYSQNAACSECVSLIGYQPVNILSRGFDRTLKIATLNKMAKEGCPLCRSIVQRFRPGVAARFNMPHAVVLPTDQDIDITVQILRAGTMDASLVFVDRDKPRDMLEYRLARRSSSVADPAQRLTGTWVPGPTVTNKFDTTIRAWIHNCDRDHKRCPKHDPTAAFMPTRAIDVSSDPPRLHVCQIGNVAQREPYVALSYCWGQGPRQLVTTASNLQSHLQGLDEQSLSQTVKDAITVTQKIGLKYLWIDALCIIQDDDQDKVQELGQMHEIYKRAYLTICAGRASSCHEGFLGPRTNSTVSLDGSIPISLQYHAGQHGASGTVLLIERRNYLTFSSGNHDSRSKGQLDPIHERGWTLQEVLLSSRLLFFAKTQLYFICQEESNQDGGIDDWETYATISGFYRLWGLPFKHNKKLPVAKNEFHIVLPPDGENDQDDDKRPDPRPVDTWERVMEDYSRRQLSVSSDKLPALSSIATEFHAATDMRYLVGLWEPWLPGALLWRVHVKGLSYKDLHVPRPPPHEWRAPSWSWLAIDRRVIHEPKLSCLVSDQGNLAEFVSCDVVLKWPSLPFGEVTDAILKLRAFPARCLSILLDPFGTHHTLNELDGDTITSIGHVYLDEPWVSNSDPPTNPFPSSLPSRSIHVGGADSQRLITFTDCMCLGIKVFSDSTVAGLLIYEAEEGSGKWLRLGMFLTYPREEVSRSFMGGEKVVYTLI